MRLRQGWQVQVSEGLRLRQAEKPGRYEVGYSSAPRDVDYGPRRAVRMGCRSPVGLTVDSSPWNAANYGGQSCGKVRPLPPYSHDVRALCKHHGGNLAGVFGFHVEARAATEGQCARMRSPRYRCRDRHHLCSPRPLPGWRAGTVGLHLGSIRFLDQGVDAVEQRRLCGGDRDRRSRQRTQAGGVLLSVPNSIPCTMVKRRSVRLDRRWAS